MQWKEELQERERASTSRHGYVQVHTFIQRESLRGQQWLLSTILLNHLYNILMYLGEGFGWTVFFFLYIQPTLEVHDPYIIKYIYLYILCQNAQFVFLIKKKSQFILHLETTNWHGNRKFQKFVKVVVGNFHLTNIWGYHVTMTWLGCL